MMLSIKKRLKLFVLLGCMFFAASMNAATNDDLISLEAWGNQAIYDAIHQFDTEYTNGIRFIFEIPTNSITDNNTN